MKPNIFDDMTKAIATATTRRQALKTLVATALGGLFGLGGIGTTLAKPCKPNGYGCNINNQCCSGGCCHGTCTDLNTTSNCGSCGHTCGNGQLCQNGTCVTPCTPNGGHCTQDSQCCSGMCDAYSGTCVSQGTTTPGALPRISEW